MEFSAISTPRPAPGQRIRSAADARRPQGSDCAVTPRAARPPAICLMLAPMLGALLWAALIALAV